MSAEVLAALRRSRALGFLGPGALDDQVEHALGFAEAAEAVFADAVKAEKGVAGRGRPGGGETMAPVTLPEPDPDHRHPGPRPRSVLDLGSGGGLPGLVLGDVWPRAELVLLEAADRRATFLAESVEVLHWSARAWVVHRRAEEAARLPRWRGAFDLVVARSFGPPPVTAECAAPFLRVGGLLIVSEPPVSQEKDGPETSARSLREASPPSDGPAEREGAGRWPATGLAMVGLEPVVEIRRRFGYQVMRQVAPCPERYPRRVGIPAKRHLYR